jgi:hypothetical protein
MVMMVMMLMVMMMMMMINIDDGIDECDDAEPIMVRLW